MIEENIKEKLKRIKATSEKRQKNQSDLIKWLLNFSVLLGIIMGSFWINSRTTGYFAFSGYNVIVGSIFGLLFLIYFLINILPKRE